ncbi:MAG: polysaccharide biosynthesis tyrosine autokinase [Burkholderiaceae bacterium]
MPASRHNDLLHLARAATPALVTVWRLILANKTLILGIAAIVTLLSALVVFQLTPIYRASATVLVESAKNKVVSIDEVYGGISSTREYFQTQADFLRSREVALRVIRQLELTDNPLFDPRQSGFSIGALWSKLSGKEAAELDHEKLENIVLTRFQRGLGIAQMRMSQLIEVSYESPDAVLAGKIANAVAEQYIRADLDARFEMTQKANAWLSERLSVLRDKLDQSEKALQQYRDESGIVEGKNTAQGSAGRQLDEISQRLVQAKVARAQAEQIYNQVRSTSDKRYQVPAVFNNPAVAHAREAEVAAEAKLVEIAQKVGTAHPQYLAAQNELRSARQNTIRQADAVIASIAKDYEVTAATERAIDEQLNRARNSLQTFNRKELQLDALDREAASNRQIYQTFLSRTKETNATGDFLTPVARVIDPASTPMEPAKPPKLQLIGLGVLLGLALGGLAAWLRERMTHVIRSSDDVDTLLRQPLLAAFPLLPAKQAERAALMQIEHPGSLFAESIRSVLTDVSLATIDEPQPIIAFTSTLPGEGKSTLSINFALEQARTKNVLLIDLDLRRPTIGGKLGLPDDSRGAADLLAGRAEVEQCLYRMDRLKEGLRLTVMPAGKARPNAHELVSGPRFADRLATMRDQFDIILIDTPPMQVVSDVMLIAASCTGVVYVVRSGETPVPLIQRSLNRLAKAGAPVFGVALNGHDYHRAEKYYGEYSAYTKYGYEST